MILKGKNIIVTGSEGLLGKAIVADIKREGATVICLDINCVDDPEEHQYKVDLTREEEVTSLIESLIDNYRQIHGLVNNAYPRTKDWGKESIQLN